MNPSVVPSSAYCRWLAVPILWVALGLPRLGGQPAPSDPVVELPQFLVTDTRELPPPESWRYAQIPGFEILSNASERESLRLIRDFEAFRQALNLIWPVPQRPQRPTLLILCGRRNAYDAFAPDGPRPPDSASASRFLRNPEHSAIILDLQSKVLDVLGDDVGADPTGATDFSQISVDHNKQLYREYLFHLLGTASPRPPAWFEEGLAQLVMGMKVEKTRIIFGQIEESNSVSASAGAVAAVNAAAGSDDPDLTPQPGAPAEDRDFNVALFRRALVPMPVFLSVKHGAPETQNPLGNNRWAKQAYAFVHMCLYGRGGRHQQAFGNYLMRLSRGEEATEQLFKECFKLDYKTMELELRSYIQFTDYQARGIRATKGQSFDFVTQVDFREATQAEVGRIKGEALLLANKAEAARREFVAPYARGERDPELLASLGLVERAAGNDERARKLLEAAFAPTPATRGRAHFELARLRFAAAAANPGAGDKLSPAQAEAILAPLLAARTQPPAIAAVYETMADVWLASGLKPTREQVAYLFEGARQFPRRNPLAYKAATVCAASGYTDEAKALIEYGKGHATNAEQVRQFDALQASLTTP